MGLPINRVCTIITRWKICWVNPPPPLTGETCVRHHATWHTLWMIFLVLSLVQYAFTQMMSCYIELLTLQRIVISSSITWLHYANELLIGKWHSMPQSVTICDWVCENRSYRPWQVVWFYHTKTKLDEWTIKYHNHRQPE